MTPLTPEFRTMAHLILNGYFKRDMWAILEVKSTTLIEKLCEIESKTIFIFKVMIDSWVADYLLYALASDQFK